MEMIPYSKDGKRPLSRFHAEEMVYEYCSDQLDHVRRELMKEALQKDPTLMEEVDQVRKALDYCGHLSHYPISVKEVEKLKKDSSLNLIDGLIERTRIQQWPPGMRLGLESLLVVSAIFVVAMIVPWTTLIDTVQSERGSVLLTEIRKDYHPERSTGEMVAMDKTLVYDDEGIPEEEAKPPVKPLVGSLGIIPQVGVVTPPAPIRPDPSPSPIRARVTAEPKTKAAPESASSTKAVAARGSASAETDTESSTETKKESKLQGILYRGRLDVTNVEATTPKLVAIVTDLGGRKAGNVPIGWRKDTGSYFHFTIPEAKYPELERLFQEYGPLKINKEAHGRVMPEGIIRLIIEVEEKNPGNNGT